MILGRSARSQGAFGTLVTGVPSGTVSTFGRRRAPVRGLRCRHFSHHAHPRIPHPRPARRRRRGRRHRRSRPALVRRGAARRVEGARIDTGPVDRLVAGMERWVSQTEGTTGWDALGVWGTVIAALAALTAAGAVACLVPALQGDRPRRAALRRARLLRRGGVEARRHPGRERGARAALRRLRGRRRRPDRVQLRAPPSPRRRSGTATTAPAAYTRRPPPPQYETAGSAPPPGA